MVVKEKEGEGQELTDEQKSELEKLTEEQRIKLYSIELLIYIVIRNIDESAKTVNDIVTSQLGFKKKGTFMSQPALQKELTGVLENVTEHKYLTLLLDGFDEMSEMSENNEVLINLFKGDSHQNLNYITTCRPSVSLGILRYIDVEIKLKGFTLAQAEAFVRMFPRYIARCTKEDKRESFFNRTMSEIKSSADLLEMSTNPSMLQLLCLISWEKGNIRKHRTSVFKYYTRNLLKQYHIKQGLEEKLYSDNLYHQILLHAGKLALKALKQNQLQLEFLENKANKTEDKPLFKIGFLTVTDDNKVQFTHETLQEYLAAYYVTKAPGNEGLQLLMDFCCTSQSLIGSKMILEFVTAMSEKKEKEMGKKIKDYVSSWDSDEKLDPKSHTSFLISMLKGNKRLTFRLPAEIDIDLREYDVVPGHFSNCVNISKSSKSSLERFFELDGKGVKNIKLILGEQKRLNVLVNKTMDSVEELTINYCNSSAEEDKEDLTEVMMRIKPQLLCIAYCERKLMDKATVAVILQHEDLHTLILTQCDLNNEQLFIILKTKHHLKVLLFDGGGVIIDGEVLEAVSTLSYDIKLSISGKKVTLFHDSATKKFLSMSNCEIQIDTKIAQAVFRMPDHTLLDLSGNRVTDKSACIILIHKALTMKFLGMHNCMSNCGIQIDTDIAEAVSKLPDHTQLNLSGNQVTDKSACVTLIHKAATMKYLNIHDCMSNCGIQIDTKIAEAVSKLPDHTQLDLSGNQVTDKSACITLIHKAAKMKSLNIHDCMTNCGIQIDTEIAEAVSRLPDHTQLDLSGNQVTDKSTCITLIHKAANMKSLSICNCGIQIDTEIAEAVSKLPDHTELDLSGNLVTYKFACISLIHKAATMKSLNIHDCMSNCGIPIDTEIAEAVSRLPDHTHLDLSGNQVTDRSACITLLHKAVTMKFLNIHDCMSNCGIEIDTKIAEAVSRLPDDILLDQSGNKLTKMYPRLLPGVLIHMAEDEDINMTGWGITIDVDIVKALSKMPQLKSLKASCNELKPEAAREFSMSQLQLLELSNCSINDTVCVSLMISLSKHCPLLEILNLNNKGLARFDNKLTSDEWCHHVQMKQLKELYLSNCGINDPVYVSLMISLSKHCPLLEILNLSNKGRAGFNNKVTSDEWCHHVQMKQLKELYLSNCGINDTVYVSLMISLSRHCPKLQILKLGYNHLTSSGVLEIIECFKHMKKLRELGLYGNPCMKDQQCREKIKVALQKSNPWLEVKTAQF